MTSHALVTLEEQVAGNGRIDSIEGRAVALENGPQPHGYALAQLDDYRRLDRHDFRWAPPLHLKLQARSSLPGPVGTLGFGFWNDPFSLSLGQAGAARRLPASPQALWFFYASPPNDIILAPPVPGSGWKAAVLRSPRIPPLLLAPAALTAFAAAQVRPLRRFVIGAARNVIQAEEALMTQRLDRTHSYELIWERSQAIFRVDGDEVLRSQITPRPPLGFVVWIDNQYAVASPEGGFRFGVTPTTKEQSLIIRDLQINGQPMAFRDERDA